MQRMTIAPLGVRRGRLPGSGARVLETDWDAIDCEPARRASQAGAGGTRSEDHALRQHASLEAARRAASDPTVEDKLHLIRATQIEVITDYLLEIEHRQ